MGSSSKAGGTVRVDRVYPHAPQKVWRALTESELLGQWLMENDFAPVVGHQFTFRTDPGPGFDGVVHCEVMEIEPPHRMKWSWRGGPLDTEVEFELQEVAGGTRLRVTHTGFRGVKSRLVQWILAIGSRTLYGKRLPQLLDSLDEAPQSMTPGSSPTNSQNPRQEPQACMSPWQRVLIAATGWIPGRERPSERSGSPARDRNPDPESHDQTP